MKIKLSNLIQLVLSLSLGFGLVYWFIHQMTPEQKTATIDSFKRADYEWLFVTLLFGLASNFIRAQRWRLMLRPLGYNPGYWNTFYSINVMFFANLFIPRLGEVSRCGILAKYEDVPVEKSIGTMVVERIFDLICILLLLGFLLIVESEKIYNLLQNTFGDKSSADTTSETHWLLKYGIPILLVIGIAVVSIVIIRKRGFQELINEITHRIKGLLEGLAATFRMKNFVQFIILTIGLWAAYVFMTYFAFFSLPETSSLGIFPAIGCLIFGGFAMVATPGGIGTFPLAVRAVLMLYGIPEVIGGALGTMTWGTQTIGVFLMGICSLILLAIVNPNKK